MNARIESMSHGDGKVYLQMVLDRLHPDGEVLLDARLKDGTKVPAHLFPFDPTEESSMANYVVVLPRFDVREVDLTFLEFTGQGSPLGQSRLTVELNLMWWRTRFNAVVHNELLEQMFGIEREYSAGRMNVYFTDAIEDDGELVVKMLADMPHREGSDVMVDFTDAQGKEIELPIYPLIDEVAAAGAYGDEERLRIGFSVRVPVEDSDFCVTVYDANEQLPGGFAHFCDETYEPLREAFLYCATDAGYDECYPQWFLDHCATAAQLDWQRTKRFACQPLVSLVMPVFAGDECYLPSALDSLRQQTYERFELLLVNVGADEETISQVLSDWEGDERLVHLVPEGQLSEAAARLTGLLQAKGAARAVMEPRVMLAPEALFEYVRLVNEAFDGQVDGVGQLDVVYANHDQLNRTTGLHSPAFKPVYSPDLLYSYNYLGSLVFYSADVLEAIQNSCGFASEAFDYDLALKATAQAQRIERIDKVLYHVLDFQSFGPKAQAIAAAREEEQFRTGRKALANHLRRTDVEAVVLSDISQRLYRVEYAPAAAKVAVAVLAGNDPALLDACLASIAEGTLPEGTEVMVVTSQDTVRDVTVYCDHLRRKNRATVVAFEGPNNRAAMINATFNVCDADYVLLLEADTELVQGDEVQRLLAHCQRKDVGVVGAKTLFPDDTIRHAGLMVGPYGFSAPIGRNMPRTMPGYGCRFQCASNVSAVSLSAMMVKRAAFDAVGGFDERFELRPCEVDFCLKLAKEGYRVAFNGDIEVYRKGSNYDGRATLSPAQVLRSEREKAFLHYRWPKLFIEGDPYIGASFNAQVPYFLLNPSR